MLSFARAWQWFRKVDAIQGSLTSDAAKMLLWPVCGAVVTFVSGLVSAVPLPYLLASASLVFAALTTGLLRLDEWRERAHPGGRLVLEHPIFNADIDATPDGPSIRNVQLGIGLKNHAIFPLNYRVDYIDTRFIDRVAAENTDRKDGLQISAKSERWFRDNIIHLSIPVPEWVAIGRVRFKVSYWKRPNRVFVLEQRVRVEAKFDPSSQRYRHTWSHE